jgi:hypothetical protein
MTFARERAQLNGPIDLMDPMDSIREMRPPAET